MHHIPYTISVQPKLIFDLPLRPLTVLNQFAIVSSAPPNLCFPFCSFMKRKGIVVNETAVLLYGQLLTGRKYVPKANGEVELEKQWSKQVLPFAYQTVVKVKLLQTDSLHTNGKEVPQ